MPPEEGLPPERRPRNLDEVRFYVDEDLRPVGAAMMWTRRSALAVRHRLRIVCVHDETGTLTMWAKLSLVARHWGGIESFVDRHPSGPWWLSVTASGHRELAYAAISSF